MSRARNESNDHRHRTSTSGSRPNMGDGLPALLPSGLRKDRSPVRLAFEPHGGTFMPSPARDLKEPIAPSICFLSSGSAGGLRNKGR